MSAFIVDPEHIHVLIWAGLRHHRGWELRWYYDNPTRVGVLTGDTVDTVGQMLLDANTASVNARYREDTEAGDYRWRTPRSTGWTPVEVIKALQCYIYQSCEVPDWDGSQAERFCDSLLDALISALPGYAAAPWTITTTATPAAAVTR